MKGVFFKKNPLNHVGARYRDDQNEKHPPKTIFEQACALKLNNLPPNIKENLQNKTPTYIHLSFRDYLKNKSRPRKRLTEDALQSSVKRVARRSDLDCLILTANVLLRKTLC